MFPLKNLARKELKISIHAHQEMTPTMVMIVDFLLKSSQIGLLPNIHEHILNKHNMKNNSQ